MGHDGPLPHAFIERLPEAGVVVDVGCGYGHWAAMVATSTRRVIGLDLSAAMVGGFVGADIGPAGRADARMLPLRDSFADGVLMMWMLYHVSDVRQTLTEARRIAKAGAPIVAATNADRISQGLDDVYRQAVGVALGEPVGRWHPALSFNAANGASMMREVFGEVEELRWTTTYRLDDPAPAVDFLLSLKEPVEDEVGTAIDWSVAGREVERFLAVEIEQSGFVEFERQGAVFISTASEAP